MFAILFVRTIFADTSSQNSTIVVQQNPARLKDIPATGIIGKVLNSEIHADGNLMLRDTLPEQLAYFADRRVGGYPINIHYGHMIDYVHGVLGSWKEFHAIGQIQRPSLNIFGTDGQITGSVKSEVPDYLSIHGSLEGKNNVTVPGAPLAAMFRLGPWFNEEPGLIWTTNGGKEKLRLTAPGPYFQADYSYDGPIKIAHHDHTTDKVTELKWDWTGWQNNYGLRARSSAELYEKYAEWIENGWSEILPEDRQWLRLEDGVALMMEFDTLYKHSGPDW